MEFKIEPVLVPKVFSPLIRPESSCTVWDYGSLLEAHRNRLLMRAEAAKGRAPIIDASVQ